MSKSTIFYQNSAGFMCQWSGTVIAKTESSVDIKFSKNKTLRFDLRKSGFLLVTKKQMTRIGACITDRVETMCFDDKIIELVKSKTVGNVSMLWDGKKWN